MTERNDGSSAPNLPFVRPAGGVVESRGRPSSRHLQKAAARRASQKRRAAAGAQPRAGEAEHGEHPPFDAPCAPWHLRAGHEIVLLLSRIAREHGVAVLISAHEMNPLLGVMDRIVYLAGGRAASGTTEEVVRSDVLSDLYGHRVDVLHVQGRVLVVAGHHDDGSDGPASAIEAVS